MTTFTPNKTILIESLVATAVTLAVLAAADVSHLGLGVLHPHPVWLVVLVVSARYGARGLVVSAPVAWTALTVVAAPWAVAGTGPVAASGGWRSGPAMLLATLATPVELGALAGAVMVGWVASAHERRERAATGKLEALERRASLDVAAIDELRRAALALRTRNDRLDVSLTFLRGVARRLDGDDATAAAEAALELATARLGARAAAVLLLQAPAREARDGRQEQGAEVLAPYAVIGMWNLDVGGAGADRTVAAALRSRAATRAMDLASGGPEDSDLAAPIIEVGPDGDVESGEIRGVLAVRGVPRGGVSVAALRDLAVIAEWSAAALAGAGSDHGAPTRVIPGLEPSPASGRLPPKLDHKSDHNPDHNPKHAVAADA